MIDTDIITITVSQRDDGRFDGFMFAGGKHVLDMQPQGTPDQVVFDAYSWLVHERNARQPSHTTGA